MKVLALTSQESPPVWGEWLTCESFCCIISSNDEDLIGDLDGQGRSVGTFTRPIPRR